MTATEFSATDAASARYGDAVALGDFVASVAEYARVQHERLGKHRAGGAAIERGVFRACGWAFSKLRGAFRSRRSQPEFAEEGPQRSSLLEEEAAKARALGTFNAI